MSAIDFSDDQSKGRGALPAILRRILPGGFYACYRHEYVVKNPRRADRRAAASRPAWRAAAPGVGVARRAPNAALKQDHRIHTLIAVLTLYMAACAPHYAQRLCLAVVAVRTRTAARAWGWPIFSSASQAATAIGQELEKLGMGRIFTNGNLCRRRHSEMDGGKPRKSRPLPALLARFA